MVLMDSSDASGPYEGPGMLQVLSPFSPVCIAHCKPNAFCLDSHNQEGLSEWIITYFLSEVRFISKAYLSQKEVTLTDQVEQKTV